MLMIEGRFLHFCPWLSSSVTEVVNLLSFTVPIQSLELPAKVWVGDLTDKTGKSNVSREKGRDDQTYVGNQVGTDICRVSGRSDRGREDGEE